MHLQRVETRCYPLIEFYLLTCLLCSREMSVWFAFVRFLQLYLPLLGRNKVQFAYKISAIVQGFHHHNCLSAGKD